MFSANEKKLTKIAKFWSYIAIFIAILDIITFVAFTFAYHKCLNIIYSKNSKELFLLCMKVLKQQKYYYDKHSNNCLEEICAEGIFPLITIAVRGYFFWIMNLIMIVMVITKVKKSEETHLKRQTQVTPTLPADGNDRR